MQINKNTNYINGIRKNDKAKKLATNLEVIRNNIDSVNTPNLSKIKEILKRVHFADINNDQQALDNKGDVYYKLNSTDFYGEYFNNLTLDYTIVPKNTGLVYGLFSVKTDKNGTDTVIYEGAKFSNYARFIADICSQNVIYTKELNCFVFVLDNQFEVIDSINFEKYYSVDNNQAITDFLEVLEILFEEVIAESMHDYNIHKNTLAAKDFTYNCKELELINNVTLNPTDLYFAYYDIHYMELNLDLAESFFKMVADNDKSLHNLKLIHAYVMHRKLKLIPAEKWFLLKDFGRTGKGLLLDTFQTIFKCNQVSFDALKSTGFEATNEMTNFYGAEVAIANETGEIDEKDMRILRKIATSEVVTARSIGQNAIRFKNEAVLILDSNENIDIGKIAANTSRTVKVPFKDRPRGETDQERHKVFKPYWDFVQPQGENSIAASLSFLINSLDFLKEIKGKFIFNDVAIKNYASAEDLTETQRILITVINEHGFILSGDEILQKSIEDDYGSLRFKQAQKDIKAIGVSLNISKKIDGKVFKVNTIGDEKVFNQSVKLLEAFEVT